MPNFPIIGLLPMLHLTPPLKYAMVLTPLPPLIFTIPQESRVSFEAEARAKEIKKLHEQVRAQIFKVNEQHKQKANKNRPHLEFELGDFVWLHLRKKRFPSRRKNKLMTRGDDP